MSKRDIDSELVEAIEKHAYPLGGAMHEYDPIIKASRGCRFVFLGEASHGTKEFYRSRAEISERLIEEEGFDAIAVEADWPDAYKVNRFVSLPGSHPTADESLGGFQRFPTWMWRNEEVLHFIEWLKGHNQEFRIAGSGVDYPAGFYGLDLYSMSSSIDAVIAYLGKVDPEAAVRARQRYACLDQFIDEPQAYGYAAEFGLSDSCEREIVAQLVELRRNAFAYLKSDGFVAEDEQFCAEQNASLVRDAEDYYRSMFKGGVNTWNIRDQHIYETLEDISEHVSRKLGREARLIVWAHNSHIGNAAATEMSRSGQHNIGQLARRVHGRKVLLVGYSTCRGTVTAASDWGAPTKRKAVSEPIPGSYEHVFHHVNHKQFMLDLRQDNKATDLLMEPRLERAIGVIYRPETERESHYFEAVLPEQFDFILHYDETSAVKPLEAEMHWQSTELDETYPSGL